jgi:alcohol dehydrogenase YqhD (iron-dependent ADH family)
LSEASLKTIINNTPKVLEDNEDYAAKINQTINKKPKADNFCSI